MSMPTRGSGSRLSVFVVTLALLGGACGEPSRSETHAAFVDDTRRALDNREAKLAAREAEFRAREEDLAERVHRLSESERRLDDREADVDRRADQVDARVLALGLADTLAANIVAGLSSADVLRTVPPPDLSRVEGRLVVLETLEPLGDWEASARARGIAQLLEVRDEHLLRGAVGSYRASAGLEVDIDMLRELNERAGFGTVELPENLYRLLDADTLASLDERWGAHRDYLLQRAADMPGFPVERALEQASERLERITEAKAQAPLSLRGPTAEELASLDLDVEARSWLRAAESAREAAIDRREADLLAKALAIDGTDLPARLRLQELDVDLPSGSVADTVRSTQRILSLERDLGLRPLEPGSDAAELIRNRFADPLAAVEAEAQLQMRWLDLRELPEEVRARLLPGELATSFPDWVVSQMDDYRLLEARRYLDDARAYVAIAEARAAAEFELTGSIDLDAVAEEHGAIGRELAYREEHGRSRGLPYEDWPGDVLARHAGISFEPAGGLRSEFVHWDALRRFSARTNATPEVVRGIAMLELPGFEPMIETLEQHTKRLDEWAEALSEVGGEPDFSFELSKARETVGEQADRIDNALAKNARAAGDPALGEELRARLAGLRLGFVEGAAVPYGDPAFAELGTAATRWQGELDSALEYRTAAWKAAGSMVDVDRAGLVEMLAEESLDITAEDVRARYADVLMERHSLKELVEMRAEARATVFEFGGEHRGFVKEVLESSGLPSDGVRFKGKDLAGRETYEISVGNQTITKVINGSGGDRSL